MIKKFSLALWSTSYFITVWQLSKILLPLVACCYPPRFPLPLLLRMRRLLEAAAFWDTQTGCSGADFWSRNSNQCLSWLRMNHWNRPNTLLSCRCSRPTQEAGKRNSDTFIFSVTTDPEVFRFVVPRSNRRANASYMFEWRSPKGIIIKFLDQILRKAPNTTPQVREKCQ